MFKGLKINRQLFPTVLCCAALIFNLSACNSGKEAATVTSEITTEAQETSAENVVHGNRAAVALYNESATENYENTPFTSYTFELLHYSDRYIVTAELNDDSSAITLTVEDNSFDFTTLEVTPPENYTLNIPFSQKDASMVCKVIKNTVDEMPVPEMVSFIFYLNDFDDESLPLTVTKYYTIKDNRLEPIQVIDKTGDTANKLEFCPDSNLYHTEALAFMPEPIVETDENGELFTTIYMYKFNPDKLTLTKEKVDSSVENPLYFGYASKAVADYVYSFFTQTSLNVTDYEHYVEVPSINSDTADYFFKVDDERFKSLSDLKAFTEKYFSPVIVNRMFVNAPQKYRDIGGELYTIVGDGGWDETLGAVTITGFEKNGNVLKYHTKQEKFSEDGEFANYLDSGEFTIEVPEDGTGFTVLDYRYTY